MTVRENEPLLVLPTHYVLYICSLFVALNERLLTASLDVDSRSLPAVDSDDLFCVSSHGLYPVHNPCSTYAT